MQRSRVCDLPPHFVFLLMYDIPVPLFCVGVQCQVCVFFPWALISLCSLDRHYVWASCLPEAGMSPGVPDPIALLWRLCSQTDLLPLPGNLIQLRLVLQFQSQHGCSAQAEIDKYWVLLQKTPAWLINELTTRCHVYYHKVAAEFVKSNLRFSKKFLLPHQQSNTCCQSKKYIF